MNKNDAGCLEYTIVIGVVLLLVAVLIGIQSFVLQMLWNFALVDSLHLVDTYMSFKVAVAFLFLLWIIGGFFKTSVTVKK